MFSFLGYLDAKQWLFINYFDIILKIFDVSTKKEYNWIGSEERNMFTNLESEMKKAHISRKDLAVALNLTYTAVSYKMTGVTDFKLNEMKTIKKALKTDKSLDYLFMTSAEIGEVIDNGCHNEDSKES